MKLEYICYFLRTNYNLEKYCTEWLTSRLDIHRLFIDYVVSNITRNICSKIIWSTRM